MPQLIHPPHDRLGPALAQALASHDDSEGPARCLITLPRGTAYQWMGAALAAAYRDHLERPQITICLTEDGGPVPPRWASPCPALPLSTSATQLQSIFATLPPPQHWRLAPFSGLTTPSWAHTVWVQDDPLSAWPPADRWPGLGEGLLVAGAPASGRSTWLYSKCLPRMAFCPPGGGPPWSLAVCTPGLPPMEALLAALGRALKVKPEFAAVDEAFARRDARGPILVAIEALDRWLAHPAQSLAASAALTGWLESGRPIAVVGTLDVAHAARLGQLGELGRWLQKRIVFMPSPGSEGLAASLEHRAQIAGLKWAPGAVEYIVTEAMRTAAPLAELAWLTHNAQRRVTPEGVLPRPESPCLAEALDLWLEALPRKAARACLSLWRSRGPESGPDPSAHIEPEALSQARVVLADNALLPLGGGRMRPGRPEAPLADHHWSWWRLWPTLHSDAALASGQPAPAEGHLQELAQAAHAALVRLRTRLPHEAPTLRGAIESLITLRQALGDDPEGGHLSGAFDGHWQAIQQARRRHDLDEARRQARRAVDVARALVRLRPEEPEPARTLSRALLMLGDLCLELDAFPEALSVHEEALEIRSSLATARPEAVVYARDLTVALERMSDLYLLQDDLPSAHQALTTVRKMRAGLAEAHPDDTRLVNDLLVALTRLGELEIHGGGWSSGLRSYREAATIGRRMLTAQPFDEHIAQMAWQLEHRLGTLSLGAGDLETPRSMMPGALHLAERWAHRPWGAAAAVRSLILLVEVELAARRLDQGLAYVAEIFTLLRDLGMAAQLVPWWAWALRLAGALRFALAIQSRQKPTLAFERLQLSWRLWMAWLASDHGDAPLDGLNPRDAWIDTSAALADAALALGHEGTCLKVCRSLLRWYGLGEGLPAHQHRAGAVAWSRQGDLAASKGQWHKAAQACEKAIAHLDVLTRLEAGDQRHGVELEDARIRAAQWAAQAAGGGTGTPRA